MSEAKKLGLLLAVFAAAYFVPVGDPRVQGAILEAFAMLREYAREHVLTCLVPAFFIAGAIAVFLAQGSVMQLLGARANKVVAYTVASVSGTLLAVCSCTVLPLFAGIYKRGAGIGPASAFLYSGPAINILAMVLTARVLGWELGLARAVAAILVGLLIGLIMGFLFRKEEQARADAVDPFANAGEGQRPMKQSATFLGLMVALLVFAAWGHSSGGLPGLIYAIKWPVSATLLVAILWLSFRWFDADERREWIEETWTFVKLIAPLLFVGVLFAGLLLGRPGTDAGLIPAAWVEDLLGGNSLLTNLFAAVAGSLMYFATLTEIPILQGLLGQGMGQGPALALLLAGPALSLPNLLVIHGVFGTEKTAAYAGLVVIMSTLAGVVFGSLV